MPLPDRVTIQIPGTPENATDLTGPATWWISLREDRIGSKKLRASIASWLAATWRLASTRLYCSQAIRLLQAKITWTCLDEMRRDRTKSNDVCRRR